VTSGQSPQKCEMQYQFITVCKTTVMLNTVNAKITARYQTNILKCYVSCIKTDSRMYVLSTLCVTKEFKCRNYLQLSLINVENQFCHNCVWRTKYIINNDTCPLTQRWNSFKYIRSQKRTLQRYCNLHCI